MRRALASLTLLLTFLLCFAGTASGAYLDVTSKNRVGVSEQNPDIRTYTIGSLELEPQRGDTIVGYDSATGVVFYVNQNPWTHFDPLGLWLMEKMPSWYQGASSLPGGMYLVPGAAVVGIVDGVAEPAIEANGAYKAAMNSGDSAADAVGYGAAVFGARATGMLDVGEGISGEAMTFDSDGNAIFTQLTDEERVNKVLEGGAKMAATAVGGAKGGKGLSNRRKGTDPSGGAGPSGNNATKNRVKPRKSTLAEVDKRQPLDGDGDMTDPNTGEKLTPGEIDLGHKPGQEWRKRKAMHEKKESTRKEVIEAENDPDLYQWEDRSSNRSHQYEDD